MEADENEDDGFVKNISDEEIDKKFEKVDQEYQKNPKYRPETAGVPASYSKKPLLYNEFSKFVEVNHIDREAFCPTMNIFTNPKELLECFNKVGFKTTPEEVFSIFVDNKCEKTEYLSMDIFYAKLTCWGDAKKYNYDVNGLQRQADNVIRIISFRKRPATTKQT